MNKEIFEKRIRSIKKKVSDEYDAKYGTYLPNKHDSDGWKMYGRKEALSLVLTILDEH